MKNKVVFLALVFGMLLSVLSKAETEGTYGYLTYILSDEEIKITKCDENADVVEIPGYILGYPVTTIGENAFSGCENLSEINIPENVECIDWCAFSNCIRLESVTLPAKLFALSANAFSGCYGLNNINVDEKNEYYASEDGILFSKDKRVLSKYPPGRTDAEYTVPDGVTIIGGLAFSQCDNLEKIIIPDSVAEIGTGAFNNCRNLKSAHIGCGVQLIETEAFDLCSSLTYVKYNGTQSDWEKIEISEWNNEYLLNAEILTKTGGICGDNVKWCLEDDGTLVISGEGKMYDYGDWGASLSPWADMADKIYLLVVEPSVTSIGTYAFANLDRLIEVNIADSVSLIDYYAFAGCSSLRRITLPLNLETVNGSAFFGCSNLENIEISEENENFMTVDGVLFRENDSALIRYPSGKDETVYDVPELTECIGEYAFSGSVGIKKVIVHPDVTALETGAFEYCSNLEEVIIGKGTTFIGGSAFWSCTNLKTLTVTNSIKNIGYGAFSGCMSFQTVNFYGTSDDWKSIVIQTDNDELCSSDIKYIPFINIIPSEDGETFTVEPVNIEKGKMIIIALYSNKILVQTECELYNSVGIPFTPSKEYTDISVMVWEDLTSCRPILKSKVK